MYMTNRVFASKDKVFKIACEMAMVKPTARQASKWFNKRGSAYKFRKAAVRHFNENREKKDGQL